MTTATIYMLVAAVGDSCSPLGLVWDTRAPWKVNTMLVLASLAGDCCSIQNEVVACIQKRY
jgi:hypothetical protein